MLGFKGVTIPLSLLASVVGKCNATPSREVRASALGLKPLLTPNRHQQECCASSFVEMLVLAESIKPPFTLRVSEGESATGVWFAVETPNLEMAAISLKNLVVRLGAECGDTLARGLRGDLSPSPQQLTPLTRQLIHTTRAQPQETQQQVLEMLGRLGTQTQPKNASES